MKDNLRMLQWRQKHEEIKSADDFTGLKKKIEEKQTETETGCEPVQESADRETNFCICKYKMTSSKTQNTQGLRIF